MKEPTSSQIIRKLNSYDARFESLDNKLESHSKILESHSRLLDYRSSEILKLRQDVEEIKEKVAYIPKMYEMLDGLAGEIVESRQDRIIHNSRLNDHGKRIGELEKGNGS